MSLLIHTVLYDIASLSMLMAIEFNTLRVNMREKTFKVYSFKHRFHPNKVNLHSSLLREKNVTAQIEYSMSCSL